MAKTNVNWREKLTDDQYRVLREKGTEAPFTGALLDEKRPGIFTCVACGNQLFSSDTKFDSRSGWPSFYDVATSEAVELHEDSSLGMSRVEVTCAQCGGHLGHLFDDAQDQPTGQRYCINSVALDFKPEDKE